MEQEKTLQQITAKIEFILSQDDLELPEPNEIEKRKLEAITQQLGGYHASLQRYKTRCWQAETLGLDQFTLREVAKLLTGQDYTKVKTWWGWDGKPGEWERIDDREKWSDCIFEYFYDPFGNVTWSNIGLEPLFVKGRGPMLMLGRLSDFNAEIPYAALLKVNQFKKIKIFNCFSILGPRNAFRSQRKSFQCPLSPVLVGCIYNFDYSPQDLDDPNYVAYYPLAKWTSTNKCDRER